MLYRAVSDYIRLRLAQPGSGCIKLYQATLCKIYQVVSRYIRLYQAVKGNVSLYPTFRLYDTVSVYIRLYQAILQGRP